MEEDEIQEIIKFLNTKFDKEIPGPVRFVIRRKLKKIKELDLDEFPESFRKCTIEELFLIIKDAYEKKQLKF